jgi:hypothetical protein
MCSISCENVKYVSFDSLNFKERLKFNSQPLLDMTKSFSNENYGPVRLLKIFFEKTDFVSCFSCHSDLGNVYLLVMYIGTG